MTSPIAETRFAMTPGGSSIAYQVIGEGDVTIVSVPPMAQNIEMAWEWPAIRRMFEGFGSFCRFVPFDKRGTGMSNRSLEIPRLDERVDELLAVLDDAGIERTFIMGTSEGGPMALVFAATYPGRVQGVILESSAAWLVEEAAAGDGPPGDASMWERFVAGWGTPDSVTVDVFAPSAAGDPEFQRWHQRYERNAASRDAIGRLLELALEMDARGVMHRVECPVLIVHRTGDRVVPVARARQTCELLRSHGIEVVMCEAEGDDHFLYAGDPGPSLAAIEQFTTGAVTQRPRTDTGSGRAAISTMGGFEVTIGGRPVAASRWGSKQARTLLKLLVVARGRPVVRDELIDRLWPDGNDRQRLSARLSVQLSAVRRVLQGAVIADRSTVRLDLRLVDVDIERWFAADSDEAIVDGFGGELLPEDRYDDWTGALRDEIRARYVAAVCRLADRGPDDRAVGLWRRVVREDPYNDHVHRALIAALHRQGSLGEARSAYQHYVSALDDLGVPAASWEEIVAPEP